MGKEVDELNPLYSRFFKTEVFSHRSGQAWPSRLLIRGRGFTTSQEMCDVGRDLWVETHVICNPELGGSMHDRIIINYVDVAKRNFQ